MIEPSILTPPGLPRLLFQTRARRSSSRREATFLKHWHTPNGAADVDNPATTSPALRLMRPAASRLTTDPARSVARIARRPPSSKVAFFGRSPAGQRGTGWGAARSRSSVGSSESARRVAPPPPLASQELPWLDKPLDDELSNRWLDLDPMGYFIIKLDRDQRLIVADHYTNTINKNGVACDEATGKPIPCTPGYIREASATFT